MQDSYLIFQKYKFMNSNAVSNLISFGSLLVSLIGGSVWVGVLSARVKALEDRQADTENWKSRIEGKLDIMQQENNRLIHDCKDSIITAIQEYKR